MQLQEIRKQVNRREWTQMVMDCRNSGLSIKDWCAQNGVNSKTYYYRQRRVFEAIGNRPFERTNRAMTPATDSIEFAPLRPIDVSSCMAKLHLSAGTLEIPEGFDPQTLRAIIQVMQEC
ncbi:MAG: hypothetical protein WCQ69_11255 [Bacteroidales bacterium]|mgnify:FL=1|jgi:putative transposase|nr:hypothetical protein [Eubacteriales bacterium]MDY0120284.1 hypothetical protein [Clostridia bacterium]